jgi:hypothetical protein
LLEWNEPSPAKTPVSIGAGGGTRTRTAVKPQDFKSCVSTGSTTPALSRVMRWLERRCNGCSSRITCCTQLVARHRANVTRFDRPAAPAFCRARSEAVKPSTPGRCLDPSTPAATGGTTLCLWHRFWLSPRWSRGSKLYRPREPLAAGPQPLRKNRHPQ